MIENLFSKKSLIKFQISWFFIAIVWFSWMLVSFLNIYHYSLFENTSSYIYKNKKAYQKLDEVLKITHPNRKLKYVFLVNEKYKGNKKLLDSKNNIKRTLGFIYYDFLNEIKDKKDYQEIYTNLSNIKNKNQSILNEKLFAEMYKFFLPPLFIYFLGWTIAKYYPMRKR